MNSTQESSLLKIGHFLQSENYRFVTPTPETHARVVARKRDFTPEGSLRALFGWSLATPQSYLPSSLVTLMEEAQILETEGDQLRSKVRFSSVDSLLFAHSSYPTINSDSVFFGPDSYRFIRFLYAAAKPASCLADLGCGSGVGGLALEKHFQKTQINSARRILLSDINPKALDFARLNAKLNNISNFETVLSDLTQDFHETPDLLIANPPFLVDPEHRAYRHGGESFGTELSVRIVQTALQELPSSGQLLLYTGTSVIDGKDVLWDSIRPLLTSDHIHWSYEEIDPDIFGEELDRPAYQMVDRIAAVGLSLIKN